MKHATLAVAALMSAAFLFSACTKSADTSTTASTATDTSSPAAADTSSPAADASSPAADSASAAPIAASSPDADASAPVDMKSTEGGMSVTQGNKTASYGKGTADDVKASGLPLYDGVDPSNTTVIKSSDTTAKAISVSATTNDDFDKVDAWYTAKLGSDYKASRLNFGPAHITTFKKDAGADTSSVLLTAAKDPRNGKSIVAIMLVSKTKP